MKLYNKLKMLYYLHTYVYRNFIKSVKAVVTKKDYNYYKNLELDEYKLELQEYFYRRTGEICDLDNPVSFNEKIQWLKLYDNKEIKTTLTDKFLVKDWIKENLGEEYNVPLLGVYNKFEDIDFSKLPAQFVLKANHGSGWNIIVTDKEKFNYDDAKLKFNKWLSTNYAFCGGFEMQYVDIKPCIICEEYLGKGLVDLQVWCANGKILFMVYINNPHGENFKATYDEEWNRLDFVTSKPILEKEISKPEKLELIKNIALKISKEFKFVRVDFYITANHDIKISEITFTPASGYIQWYPKETNYRFDEFNIK